ncbi:hypothetical protein QC762_511813 [Podospora pseudocomata]|uniref:Uncharacterized protein n=1 Tax=Podospora pseudocomata TaxID=2093779 RepID=A0ABR0GBX0_9PEZI|nr:hypothetical protein QC762_511813 [Podospora pseudocomata]
MIKRLGEHCNSFSFLFLFHYRTIQPTTEKMSPYIICCPIYGWRLYDIGAGWRNEFLCITPKKGKIYLTRLGVYDDPSSGGFIAPRNTAARYDDDGYTRPQKDQFATHRLAVSPAAVPLDRVFYSLDSAKDSLFPWEISGHDDEAEDAPWAADPREVNVQTILDVTYFISESWVQASRGFLGATHPLSPKHHFFPQPNMSPPSKEARVILALEALQNNEELKLEAIAKLYIVDDDVYNFDETGFMMGIIFAGMVVMTSDGLSTAKLAQPGNREWATVIHGVNALGWVIPPSSS